MNQEQAPHDLYKKQLAIEKKLLEKAIVDEQQEFGMSLIGLFAKLFDQVSADDEFGLEIMKAGQSLSHQPQTDHREVEFEHLGQPYIFSYQLAIGKERTIDVQLSVRLADSEIVLPKEDGMRENEVAFRNFSVSLFSDLPVDVSGGFLSRRKRTGNKKFVFSGVGTALLMIQDLVIRDLMKRSNKQISWQVTIFDGSYDLEDEENELTGWTSQIASRLGYKRSLSHQYDWKKEYFPKS